jgi:hypothetical protein
MKTVMFRRLFALVLLASLESSVATTTIKALPSNDPSVVGQWSSVLPFPKVSVHAALLHTGDVVVWDDMGMPAYLWRPSTGTITQATNSASVNIFCGALVTLADGRLFTAGGGSDPSVALRDATAYTPATQAWPGLAQMFYKRWYPTATTLADGRVLVVAGSDPNGGIATPEIYTPSSNTWSLVSGAPLLQPFYPFMFQLSNGKVLYAGAIESHTVTDTYTLDIPTQSWTVVDSQIVAGGSAAMYRPGVVLKSGSAALHPPFGPAVNAAFTLDMNQSVPSWQPTSSMAFNRAYHNLTLLPDGTVAATGGLTDTDSTKEAQAVLPAEIWNPSTSTWSTMAAMQTPRGYHSTALLLPDGRIFIAGGGNSPGIVDKLNAEVFSPPYLFKGARPTISSVSGGSAYGGTLSVTTPDAASIASVALMRPGAVTHSFNENQRYVPLTFTQATGGLSVQLPANGNIAPPGYYMLFLVNSTGVPSLATWVQLAGTTPPPSLTLTVNGGSSATVASGQTYQLVATSLKSACHNLYLDGVYWGTAPGWNCSGSPIICTNNNPSRTTTVSRTHTVESKDSPNCVPSSVTVSVTVTAPPNPCVTDPFSFVVTWPTDPAVVKVTGTDSRGCQVVVTR